MARSRLTYREAVRLLTGGSDVTAILGRFAGGALLVAAPFAGGALALFDAKGEANQLLRDLVGKAPDRIRASRGKAHYELIEAAHTVLVLSSFFDALEEAHGEDFRSLELTDDEKRQMGGDPMRSMRAELGNDGPSMTGPLRGFRENLGNVARALTGMVTAFTDFTAGLAARHRHPPRVVIIQRALELYQERYVRLAADVPEFAIWSQLDEHAATRAEVRKQTETLTHLAELLSRTVDAPTPGAEAERRLARHAAGVLRRPLWRADAPAPEGLSFPTVEQGFISPRFRIAVADRKTSLLGDESWWSAQSERDDLATFLAGYLTDPASTQRPLVVLGHPGAGKSLLTEVLAARLPTSAFTTIRVPLRRVDPDAQIHQQVEATVERMVKERITWGELCRASPTTKVVVLDGFDELVQATGVAQSHYIDLAASFQQEEWVNDRPVIVVITSRTLVMDRTLPPDGTVVVKLEPFDEAQVARWAGAWNAANAAVSGFRPLAAAELWHHRELAGQPLLLLMLAVHAAESAVARLDAEDLSTQELYRRLLDSFIRRQVREKSGNDLGDGAFAGLEVRGRHDLAAAAFAMFNRGRQYVSEEDLNDDLDALRPDPAAAPTRHGEPLTRARRTVAGFFFVHIAQTDDDARAPGRRTYEFLHATFAEYLVAEHTVELLEELTEDWRRARRRAYVATLDRRELRALLSHQPLTSGEQVTPFLIGLIDALPADVRPDLREALLELFRGARKRIDDDAYRPTPFDAVNRLAAYTANLVVLAALCDEEGLAVEELREPGFASTVRLWRSGLDTEAQNSLFSRLHRTGDRLRARRVEARSLPLCEAELIGDTFTEAVLLAGRAMWQVPETGPETFDLTRSQLDFHLHLLRLIVARWPARSLGRMMPFDERFYEELADLAEASADAPTPASLHLLAKLVNDDGPQLAPALLDRLVDGPFARDDDTGEPVLSTLALQQPKLYSRHPALLDRLANSPAKPFLHEVARAGGHQDPAMLKIVEDLRSAVSTEPNVISEALVTPSMVAGLAFAPHLMPRVLDSLRPFGATVWSQVRPRDLAAALALVDEEHLSRNVTREYVACRQGETFEGEDADAFAALRDRRSAAADR